MCNDPVWENLDEQKCAIMLKAIWCDCCTLHRDWKQRFDRMDIELFKILLVYFLTDLGICYGKDLPVRFSLTF